MKIVTNESQIKRWLLVCAELLTEGETVAEALDNVRDALAAVVELYEDLGKTLPLNLQVSEGSSSVWLETLVATT